MNSPHIRYKQLHTKQRKDNAHVQEGSSANRQALEFFEAFLHARLTARDLSPRTLQSNLSEYRRYIVPYMQGVKVSDITPQYLNEFYAYLHSKGGTRKTGLSIGTLRHVHAFISKAFNDAIDAGELTYNPTHRAKLPRQAKQESYCMSEQEYKRLIDLTKASNSPVAFGLFLLAITAMRRGELLALIWEDVDFTCGTISITKARGTTTFEVNAKSRVYIKEPKSPKSTRQLAIAPHFLAYVQRYKDAQELRLKRIGITQVPQTPVIDRSGEYISPDVFTHSARLFFELFEFDSRVHIHTLRHSCISMLIRAGVDSKAVSAWAGHSSISTTLDTYAHVFAGSKHDTAGQLWHAYKEIDESKKENDND